MLPWNRNCVNPYLTTAWMWANKILLSCVSKVVPLQLWAVYKFLQNKQKKDSSFLYKKNSHIVRNYILPSTARTHMTVFSFYQYRKITKRLTCMVVLKQIYWAITPSITKHSIGSSLWIIRIIKRLNPFHIWAWKQREVHQQ